MPNAQLVYLFRFLFFAGLVWVVFFNISENPSVDAVWYANAVVYGQDYVNPHHLLHGIAGRFVWLPVLKLLTGAVSPIAEPSAYTWLALSNGIAYLLIVFGVNQRLVAKGQALHPATLIVAASWGLLRYAVEFEAYLWPLFFCLAATWAVEQRRLGLASILFTVAFLFHQLSVCWILAALIVIWRQDGWRSALRLATWAWLIVPVYALGCELGREDNLAQFLFGNFASGGVKTDLQLRHLLLLPISIVRTWLQVHGYQYILITRHGPYTVLLALAGVMIAALVWLVGWIGSGRALSFLPEQSLGRSALVARWALVFTLLAGLWAQGNAEFLVGLAPGVALAYPGLFERWRKSSVAMGGLLMGANVSLTLLPQKYLILQPYKAEATWAQTSGKVLYTQHRLEVGAYLDPMPASSKNNPVRHAQRLSVASRRFYYEHALLPDTVLVVEKPAPTPFSRQALLEKELGALSVDTGSTVEKIEHIGGPTYLVELRPKR